MREFPRMTGKILHGYLSDLKDILAVEKKQQANVILTLFFAVLLGHNVNILMRVMYNSFAFFCFWKLFIILLVAQL